MQLILEVFERDANDVQNRFDVGEYVDVEMRLADSYAYPKTFRARVLGIMATPEKFNENAYPDNGD